jgi:DNA polymerase delta subunit 3
MSQRSMLRPSNSMLRIAYVLRMLYEFHRLQNGKKPGSIHAIYLVAGTKQKSAPMIINGSATRDGADELMQSSPYRSSPNPDTDDPLEDSPVLSVTLVREADLQGMLKLSVLNI